MTDDEGRPGLRCTNGDLAQRVVARLQTNIDVDLEYWS